MQLCHQNHYNDHIADQVTTTTGSSLDLTQRPSAEDGTNTELGRVLDVTLVTVLDELLGGVLDVSLGSVLDASLSTDSSDIDGMTLDCCCNCFTVSGRECSSSHGCEDSSER